MDSASRRRISDLYHAALDRPPDERDAFLNNACGSDEALRREVYSLLRYEQASAPFLETPAAVLARFDAVEMIGRQCGPYTIVALLGAGGMGDVYRARDTKLGRDVAIKILPSHFTADPERRARFAREARTLATLNHPHIGAIYGLEESDGITALILELVEGPTLADRLERGPLKIVDAVSIAGQIAEALQAAHDKDIVHRDLKPGNIVLQDSPGKLRAKVLDFGLAKTLVEPGHQGSHSGTADGRILGTPAYMSPEQARGLAVDVRTDIWAFGCVFYEMLTGRRAFDGATPSDTFVSVLQREPDWTALPAKLPASLRTLLQRCLRKDSQKRLRDIADVSIELDDVESNILGGQNRRREVQWRRIALITFSTAMLLLAAAGIVRMLSPVGPPQQASPPTPRRLTSDPGLQTHPTFSPDGGWIAYTSNKSGNFDIYVQPLSGGNAVRVTSDAAHDWSPDWSPTNDRIVFRSERNGGGLYLVPATGGREEKLTTFGDSPRWSPDGSRILFVESSLVGASHGKVFTVGRDGEPPQPLDTHGLSNQEREAGSIGWHPDGKRITYMTAPQSGAPLKVASVDVARGTIERSEVHKDVQDHFRDQILSPWPTEPLVWAPDGTAIYFVGFSRGLLNIWSVDVEPRTSAIVGGPYRITMMPLANESIALSRTGTGIAFGAADRNYRVASYRIDEASSRVVGPPQWLTSPELFAVWPDLTRDGSKLAFKVYRPGSGTGLVELRVSGVGPERTLTVDDTFARREFRGPLRWSPDGSRLAYRHFRLERTTPTSQPVAIRSLVLLDVSTGDERELTTPFSDPNYGDEVVYGWSPDGKFIVSTGGRYAPGQKAIALVPASAAPEAERHATIVTTGDDNLWNASMSPNSRWICFQAQRSTSSRLVVIASHGGDWNWLTDERFWVDKPKWSADGKLLYFISSQGGLLNVWALRFDSDRGLAVGQPFQVTHFDGSAEHISPDVGRVELAIGGGRMAFPVINPTGGIWMLENPKR